ncbi:hypothetical protein C1T17_02375 [Sphingobium sp. SCG-1]|uniref:CmcJ/NvfI family oxidoreductase n=1 Tax=Sphingobium sp. SCG-1 TaxID=2072936 RepID=UPI000CD68229|nr:CmcJ/NvfI family oxidoreductase [Sphingobium sp. SCG-1]AUW57100.1 hypothetical protein C1T17_02375 [Sphingobium sp. SCG-1]
MNQVIEKVAQPRMVEAQLSYCGHMDYKPQIGVRTKLKDGSVESDADRANRDLKIEPRSVSIRDGSSVPTMTDLDREGFIFTHHPSIMEHRPDETSDFHNEDKIVQVHFLEVRALLKELTGADVVEFPFTRGSVRSSAPGAPQGPAPFPHIDFSEAGAVNTVDRIYPDRPKDVRRWAIIQLWRCLSPDAPVDRPLALLDAQSVKPEDCVRIDVQFDTHVGMNEVFFMKYSPDHRWTYFSEMKLNDLLIFKSYDSDPGRNFPAAHVSFQETLPDAHIRMSYELRAYVGWYE